MDKNPLVSVVVVNYNGVRYLKDCFSALAKQTYPAERLQIIMVDSGSRDGSVDLVQKHFPQVTVVKQRENNYCGGNNAGVRRARGKYVAFLNNDTRVTETWLQALVAAMEADETIGIAGSRILFMDGKVQSAGHEAYPAFSWGDAGFRDANTVRYDESAEAVSVCGASALYRVKCLRDVGPFDTDFNMFIEDVDMAWRARQKQWKVRYVAESVVYHQYHGSVKNDDQEFYCVRNRLLFVVKHAPEHLPHMASVLQMYRKEKGAAAAEHIDRILADVYAKIVDVYAGVRRAQVFVSMLEGMRALDNYEKHSFICRIDDLETQNRAAQEREGAQSAAIEELQERLRRCDTDMKERDVLFNNVIADMEATIRRGYDRDRLLAAREAELQEQAGQLGVAQKAQEELRQAVAIRDMQIRERDDLVHAKEALAAQLVAERDQLVTMKDDQARTFAAEREGLQRAYKDRESECGTLRKQHGELERTAQEIRAEMRREIEVRDVQIRERDDLVHAKEALASTLVAERDRVAGMRDDDLRRLNSERAALQDALRESEEAFARTKEELQRAAERSAAQDAALLAGRDEIRRAADSHEQHIRERDRLVEEKDTAMRKAQGELSEVRAECDRLREQNTQKDVEIQKLRDDVQKESAARDTQIRGLEATISSGEAEIRALTGDIAELRDSVRRGDDDRDRLREQGVQKDREIQDLRSKLQQAIALCDAQVGERETLIRAKETLVTQLTAERDRLAVDKATEARAYEGLLAEKQKTAERHEKECDRVRAENGQKDVALQKLRDDLCREIQVRETQLRERDVLVKAKDDLVVRTVAERDRLAAIKDEDARKYNAEIAFLRDECARSRDDVRVQTAAVQTAEQRVRDADCAAQEQIRQLTIRMQEEIRDRDLKLHEGDLQVRKQIAEVALRDECIRQRDDLMKQKDDEVYQLHMQLRQEISARNEQVRALERQVNECGDQLRAKELAIEKGLQDVHALAIMKDRLAQDTDRRIAELQAIIDGFYQSRGYRLVLAPMLKLLGKNRERQTP